MTFKINEQSEVRNLVRTEDRLYLTADGSRIVGPDDPEAASLFASEGSEISRADAVKYGLVKPTKEETQALEQADKEAQADEPDATEAAAKLASEKGVDLASITGTGAEGRITKEDVEKAAADSEADEA